MKKDEYVWVLAYINRDNLDTVQNDLIENDFSAVRVFIPTVRVLKKQFKNKNIYEYVPLLFNYGFFNIPYVNACDPDFLKRLKDAIPVIYAWVRDPGKMVRGNPKLRMDNKNGEPDDNEVVEEVNEDGIKILVKPEISTQIGIVTEEEISRLISSSEKLSVFSDDIDSKLEKGQFITLKGYPYEGMPAEIVDVFPDKKQIKVKLLLEFAVAEALVHYENIFYTVYQDYSKPMRETSLDELDSKTNRTLDKLYANINYE